MQKWHCHQEKCHQKFKIKQQEEAVQSHNGPSELKLIAGLTRAELVLPLKSMGGHYEKKMKKVDLLKALLLAHAAANENNVQNCDMGINRREESPLKERREKNIQENVSVCITLHPFLSFVSLSNLLRLSPENNPTEFHHP